MNLSELTGRLVDSKRFCELFRNAGLQWTKRSMLDEDRRRLLEPLLELVVAELDGGEAQPEPERHQPRHEAALRKPELIEPLGNLGDEAGLPFDPFKQPNEQAITPTKEPDPIQRIKQHYQMLLDAMAKLPPVGYGQKVSFRMPADWNANEADRFFRELRTHTLAPNGEGIRLAPNGGGWDVTCIRQS